YYCIFRFLGAF
ncbi:unnamed protein product, partial [Callosobruchus maculatus]